MLGLVPTVSPPDMKFIGMYLTASEYLEPEARTRGLPYDADALWVDLISQHSRDDLLVALALLNRAARDAALRGAVEDAFLAPLQPSLRARIRNTVDGRLDGQRRHFLARNVILRTVRAVLAVAPTDQATLTAARAAAGLPPPGMDLVTVAIFLTHLVADAMGSRPTSAEAQLGGMGESLAMEVVQNALFHHTEDVGDLLARTATFWMDMGADSADPPFRRAPAEMAEEAIGVPLDYLISTAFRLWAHAQTFSLDGPLSLPEVGMPVSLLPHLESAMSVFTATPAELAAAFTGMSQDWQMLPLQQKPVLRMPSGLVVLDETYLMERVTSGLFWLAHDFEKARYGEKAAARWRKSYANIFERYAESQLRTFSVPALLGGTNFYTEEDLQAAYPQDGQRYSDAVLDFGSVVVVAEIVNHQFTVPTRTQGDVQAFRKDLKLGVYEKARQLDGTSQRLLRDGESLLGRRPTRIQPLLVTGGSFPHSSVTHSLIAEHLQASKHLADPRIGTLAIVGIDDLDYARIVVDKHHLSLPDILEGWLKAASRTARCGTT